MAANGRLAAVCITADHSGESLAGPDAGQSTFFAVMASVPHQFQTSDRRNGLRSPQNSSRTDQPCGSWSAVARRLTASRMIANISGGRSRVSQVNRLLRTTGQPTMGTHTWWIRSPVATIQRPLTMIQTKTKLGLCALRGPWWTALPLMAGGARSIRSSRRCGIPLTRTGAAGRRTSPTAPPSAAPGGATSHRPAPGTVPPYR
jgi:hypothetical protein